jgi:hypothetical protein
MIRLRPANFRLRQDFRRHGAFGKRAECVSDFPLIDGPLLRECPPLQDDGYEAELAAIAEALR